MQRGEHTIARLYKAHDGGPALNCSYTTCETETGELEQLAKEMDEEMARMAAKQEELDKVRFFEVLSDIFYW